jgi:hypothetical protein
LRGEQFKHASKLELEEVGVWLIIRGMPLVFVELLGPA